MYKQIAANPRVELAIPYAVGDNYKGYRLVGTTAGDLHEIPVSIRQGASKWSPAAGFSRPIRTTSSSAVTSRGSSA